MSNCNKNVLFRWIGGKRLLAKKIIAEIPGHKCYAEVFAGGAGVFFRKGRSDVEVVNDINKGIINCYRIVQNHYLELCRYIDGMLVSRDEFNRLKAIPPETLTDIQRAARFLYMQKCCFGGRYEGTFGIYKGSKPMFNPETVAKQIAMANERLNRVYIECLPYDDLIRRYDAPETFFYIDPPYYNMEDYYGRGIFYKEDFKRLRDQLAGIKGRFLMSINDVPGIRELYKPFNIKEVQTSYSINSKISKPVGELFIKNY